MAWLELQHALVQLIPTNAACVTSSVKEHLWDQTEEFPCSGLAQLVTCQLGAVSLATVTMIHSNTGEVATCPAAAQNKGTFSKDHLY